MDYFLTKVTVLRQQLDEDRATSLEKIEVSEKSYILGKSNERDTRYRQKNRYQKLQQEEHEQEQEQPRRVNLYLIYIVSLVDIGVFAYSIYKNKGFEPFKVNPMIGPSAHILIKFREEGDVHNDLTL